MKARWINRRWRVVLPDIIADWDALDDWERCRFADMEDRLRQGDILFDVGAEHGTLSAVYAAFVGAGNMVLFEPSPEMWRDIRLIWEANRLPAPRACYAGFLAAGPGNQTQQPDFDDSTVDGWPATARGPEIDTGMPYRYLWQDAHRTPATNIDSWVAATGIWPDAITIDVEGAELDVLTGAMTTLNGRRPQVWVSVHPDLMQRHHGHTVNDLRRLARDIHYEWDELCTDHETHVALRPA